MTSDVTVTIREGTFVFQGERPDGSADWRFFRSTPEGWKQSPVPKRFAKFLRKEREHG
jgi:hypothetical protein